MTARHLAPTSKVAAATSGSVIVAAVVSILSIFGIDIPQPVADAVITVTVFAAGWLKTERHPAS